MFTLYRIGLGADTKNHMFTHNNGWFRLDSCNGTTLHRANLESGSWYIGYISVPLRRNVNRYLHHSGSKWVGATTAGSILRRKWRWYLVHQNSSSVQLLFTPYQITFHVGTKWYPVYSADIALGLVYMEVGDPDRCGNMWRVTPCIM